MLPTNWALSIREKLHVPDGWCSSGLRAKEYTQIESFAPLYDTAAAVAALSTVSACVKAAVVTAKEPWVESKPPQPV